MKYDPGIGATNELTLRVSVATLVRVLFKHPNNGEWMLADGPIPFVMNGWSVTAGEKPYLGRMVNGDSVVIADVYGQSWSLITRGNEE